MENLRVCEPPGARVLMSGCGAGAEDFSSRWRVAYSETRWQSSPCGGHLQGIGSPGPPQFLATYPFIFLLSPPTSPRLLGMRSHWI